MKRRLGCSNRSPNSKVNDMNRYFWTKLKHKLMLFVKREQRIIGNVRKYWPWIATILFIIGGSTWFNLRKQTIEDDWQSETWQNNRLRQLMVDHPSFDYNRSHLLPPTHLKTQKQSREMPGLLAGNPGIYPETCDLLYFRWVFLAPFAKTCF